MVIRKAVPAFLVVAVVDGLLLLFWSRTVTDAWVRRAGEAYAEALLGSLDQAVPDQDSSAEHE